MQAGLVLILIRFNAVPVKDRCRDGLLTGSEN
jgi:hypothetical protein